MTFKKGRFANIICDESLKPLKMIVADNEYTTTIPIENSTLKTVKKAAMDVYQVAPKNILVTKVMD